MLNIAIDDRQLPTAIDVNTVTDGERSTDHLQLPARASGSSDQKIIVNRIAIVIHVELRPTCFDADAIAGDIL
jgi:hypothetical protein